jgi:hypothetical protein
VARLRDLEAISSDQVGTHFVAKALVRRENESLSDLLAHLAELDERGLQLDHVVPHAKGGEPTVDNLRPRRSRARFDQARRGFAVGRFAVGRFAVGRFAMRGGEWAVRETLATSGKLLR